MIHFSFIMLTITSTIWFCKTEANLCLAEIQIYFCEYTSFYYLYHSQNLWANKRPHQRNNQKIVYVVLFLTGYCLQLMTSFWNWFLFLFLTFRINTFYLFFSPAHQPFVCCRSSGMNTAFLAMFNAAFTSQLAHWWNLNFSLLQNSMSCKPFFPCHTIPKLLLHTAHVWVVRHSSVGTSMDLILFIAKVELILETKKLPEKFDFTYAASLASSIMQLSVFFLPNNQFAVESRNFIFFCIIQDLCCPFHFSHCLANQSQTVLSEVGIWVNGEEFILLEHLICCWTWHWFCFLLHIQFFGCIADH